MPAWYCKICAPGSCRNLSAYREKVTTLVSQAILLMYACDSSQYVGFHDSKRAPWDAVFNYVPLLRSDPEWRVETRSHCHPKWKGLCMRRFVKKAKQLAGIAWRGVPR